jgi:hypothetical protein
MSFDSTGPLVALAGLVIRHQKSRQALSPPHIFSMSPFPVKRVTEPSK